MNPVELKYHSLAFLATVLVAGSFIISAELADVISPISLTLLRFVIASVTLLPIIFLVKEYRRLLAATFPKGFIISLFYSGYFICLFESLKITTVINTGTLYTLVPLITALFAVIFFKEKIGLKRLMIYIIGAAGTIWVVFKGNIELLLSFSLNEGDLLYLFGVLSMVGYSIVMKLLYRNDEMIVLVFSTLVSGCIWMSIALVTMDVPLEWYKLSSDAWLQMAYLAFLATLITSWLFQITAVSLGPTRMMSYVYLNPALVAILQLLSHNIKIPPIVIPGIILSTLATFILQKSTHKPAAVEKA